MSHKANTIYQEAVQEALEEKFHAMPFHELVQYNPEAIEEGICEDVFRERWELCHECGGDGVIPDTTYESRGEGRYELVNNGETDCPYCV